MKIQMSRQLFLPAAVLGGVAVFAAVFFVALAVRSVVADPSGPVPNPGHAWTEVQGHGDDADACYVSTESYQAFEVRVNGDRALRLEPEWVPNLIGGYSGNAVTDGSGAATISGGGESGLPNRVTDGSGTVGGGADNTAGNDDGDGGNAEFATVGGGRHNNASGPDATVGGGHGNQASANNATVGGGLSNTASGAAATVSGGVENTASGNNATVSGGASNQAQNAHATVGGGYSNDASAEGATVGGGGSNTASGYTAVVGGGVMNTAGGYAASVPGGGENTALGDFGFAAGRLANAAQNGCFVWGDSTTTTVSCDSTDEFVVQAGGGLEFYSSSDLSTYCNLNAGGNSWSCSSDRDLKENFTPVDGQAVVAALAEMPISMWNSKAQDDSIRHMGPVAQDFYAAFGLGEDELSIGSGDIDGVALAAIQGLYELSQEQAERIDALEARVAALEGGTPLERGSESLLASIMPFGPLFLAGLFVVGGLVLVERRRAGGRS
ncbi:MAG: hypothetical protein JSU97_04800 [Dehalococcoidia bacterium]|nr:MAG: hypothetical protein JSU97_04800 [Dehalococcoidia bacterium]